MSQRVVSRDSGKPFIPTNLVDYIYQEQGSCTFCTNFDHATLINSKSVVDIDRFLFSTEPPSM